MMNTGLNLHVEAVVENAVYSDAAKYEVVTLMMKADIVTIRGTSVQVDQVEVTEDGLVRFHGRLVNL
ncbi:hypothetical protein FRY77_38145 [Halomonas sp. MG34]|nr:hypothetical protein [Halomonas sp. MG34]